MLLRLHAALASPTQAVITGWVHSVTTCKRNTISNAASTISTHCKVVTMLALYMHSRRGSSYGQGCQGHVAGFPRAGVTHTHTHTYRQTSMQARWCRSVLQLRNCESVGLQRQCMQGQHLSGGMPMTQRRPPPTPPPCGTAAGCHTLQHNPTTLRLDRH